MLFIKELPSQLLNATAVQHTLIERPVLLNVVKIFEPEAR